jgi:hypothetical protein
MIRRLFTLFIALLGFYSPLKADQLLLLSNDNAEKAAAFLNKQKQIILFCDCCDNLPPLKVNVAEAAVEKYKNLGTGIRLKGSDQFQHSINQFIDLAYVWVKQNGSALNLGLVMGMRCNPCANRLNWKSMAIETPNAKANHFKPKQFSAINRLTESLNSNDTFHHLSLNGNAYKVFASVVNYDSTQNTLRVTYKAYCNGFYSLVYTIPLSEINGIRTKADHLLIRARKSKALKRSSQKAGSYVSNTLALNEIRIDLPPGVSAKRIKKDLIRLKKD